MTRGNLVRSSLLVALSATTAWAGTQSPPVLTVLPDTRYAWSVTDDGSVVVGVHADGTQAFRWTTATSTVGIGGQPGIPGSSGIVRIAGDGSVIVADAPGADNIRRASKWLSGIDWQNLPAFADSNILDGTSTSVQGISSDGKIVVGLGWSLQGGALGRKWNLATGVNNTISSLFPGTSTRLNGTNSDGSRVWGWNDTPSGTRRGIRRDGTPATSKWITYVSPENVTYYCGEALGANPDASVIVGYNIFSAGLSAGWRWDAATGETTLLPQLLGFEGSSALPSSVTADGSIVVGSTGGPPIGRAAIIWTNGQAESLFAKLVELGAVGIDGLVDVGTPLSVSPDGRFIVGFGMGFDGTPPGGWLLDFAPPPPCTADLDGDGSVGASDLALLLGAWGNCSFGGGCPADIDNDSVIGPADLAILLGGWGTCQ